MGIPMSVLSQINQQIDIDNTVESMKNKEQLKDKDILSGNAETMERIERERAFVTIEARRYEQDSKPYFTSPKVEETQKQEESTSSFNPYSRTASNYGAKPEPASSTSTYNGGWRSPYTTQQTVVTEQERQARLDKEAREYVDGILKKVNKAVKKRSEFEKSASGEGWDMFSLQSKVAKDRDSLKKLKDKGNPITEEMKKDLKKIEGRIDWGRAILETIYKKKNGGDN